MHLCIPMLYEPPLPLLFSLHCLSTLLWSCHPGTPLALYLAWPPTTPSIGTSSTPNAHCGLGSSFDMRPLPLSCRDFVGSLTLLVSQRVLITDRSKPCLMLVLLHVVYFIKALVDGKKKKKKTKNLSTCMTHYIVYG